MPDGDEEEEDEITSSSGRDVEGKDGDDHSNDSDDDHEDGQMHEEDLYDEDCDEKVDIDEEPDHGGEIWEASTFEEKCTACQQQRRRCRVDPAHGGKWEFCRSLQGRGRLEKQVRVPSLPLSVKETLCTALQT